MVPLSQILNAQCIKLNLKAKRKRDAIKEMVDLLHQTSRIKDPWKLEHELIQRERTGTTGIGGGIAIPHVMVEDISHTVMALGRRREGLKFDAIDEQPVQLIFLLVGPKGEEATHLKLLCKLARILHNTQLKNALLQAQTEEEIVHIFGQQEKKEE